MHGTVYSSQKEKLVHMGACQKNSDIYFFKMILKNIKWVCIYEEIYTIDREFRCKLIIYLYIKG